MRWLWGLMSGLCIGGCGREPPAPVFATGVQGDEMERLHLLEERDGQVVLDLTARRAQISARARKRAATLHQLRATFLVTDGGTRRVHLRAARGRVRPGGRNLELEGGLEARSDDGWWMRAERAAYDLSTRRLQVPGPVESGSPRGTAKGGRAVVDVPGEVVDLAGGVEAQLWPGY